MSDSINEVFSKPWVQEIKKSGLLMLFMPGAQISSSIILSNSTPPQNMYAASQFWASMVYFEAPNWE